MTTVTRRVVRATGSDTDGRSTESASNNQYQSTRRDSDDRRRDDERDGDDDDKEARLTLMEEVLLLGLKDREVRSIEIFLINWICCLFSFVGLYIILE